MISYHAYKLIHLVGLFLLLLSFGAQLVDWNSTRWRKYCTVSHGVGLLLLFVAGFGLLARLGIDFPWPLWIYLKMLVWLLLGLIPVLVRRSRSAGKPYWWAILLLVTFAAYLATFKPFI